MTGTDIVGRQTVEVSLSGTESDGLELQRRLARLCADAVTPELSRTLARLGPRDGLLVVDRLEIDLGTLSWDGLARELPAAVAREVASFLGRYAGRPEAGEGTAVNVRYRSHAEAAGDALLTFLRTGRLPWSFRVPAGRHLADEVLAAWTLAAGDDPASGSGPALGPGLRAALIAALAAEIPRRRLIQQFPPSFRRTLLRLLSAAAAATIDRCLDALGDVPPAPFPGATGTAAGLVHESLWDAVLARLGPGAATPGPRELLTAAWRAVPAGAPGHADLGRLLRDRLTGFAAPAEPETAEPGSAVSGPPAARPATVPGPPALTGHRTDPGGGEEDDGEYVTNAGVVLLHPFLPRFFEALGVAGGDRLAHPERALCLLHHLATGEVTAPEYDLTVAKVLCEVPADEPVPLVVLGDDEIAEADALLRAAIRHWEALRGTGPGGLRGTFLTRPGKLLDRGGDRLLRVEAETFDILLDQLPWGISTIRLPWMSRLLLVEWR